MLSQFSPGAGKETLADLFDFPKDVYPVGRLDADSEGLLILTNDKRLNHLLLNPLHEHRRVYLVQVEGNISQNDLDVLQRGVFINVNGKNFQTKECIAKIVSMPEDLPERNPPIRFRKSIPTSWIEISLAEGKNRQVRKMTAAAGFPTLRLVRVRIEEVCWKGLNPGEVKEMTKQAIYHKLNLGFSPR